MVHADGPKTNKQQSLEAVIAAAQLNLATVDLKDRLRLLGVEFREEAARVCFSALGKNYCMTSDAQIFYPHTDNDIDPVEAILVLHYLQHAAPVAAQNKPISFRELPGGQFYWQPFISRSVVPLCKRIGNDLGLLRSGLRGFVFEEVEQGDFGATIQVIGPLFVTLVYWLGDDEFGPSADLVFDAAIKHVYRTDDVAALAGFICFAIISSLAIKPHADGATPV